MPGMSEVRSVAGATTVVEDADANLTMSNSKKAYYGNGVETLKEESKKPEPFLIATDYMDESRPYFVKIGKDGVLAAIQNLDLELRNVSIHFHLFIRLYSINTNFL